MNDRIDVFISYSKANVEYVSQIVKCIESYGFNCWFQQQNSKQDFTDAIINGINESKAFLIFLSKASIKSLYVRNEIKLAAEKIDEDSSYKILPIFIEDIDSKDVDFKRLCVLIGTLNMLDIKDYRTDHELVLKIFDQIDFKLNEEQLRNSIYDGSSTIERERLVIQNKLFNRYASKYLDEIFEKIDNPNVLDVGCSDCSNILLRLEGRNYNHLVGIDYNKDKISEATEKLGDNRHHFIALDLNSDDFISEMISSLWKTDVRGFDLIHISSVLLHLKNPFKVLKSLKSLLNDGGYLFIQDEDDGTNIVFPNSTFFDNCFHIWEHSIESGDRKMARKLPFMLSEAGYKNIELKSTTMSSIDYGEEEKEALWDLYFNSDYWDTTDASYFDDLKSFELLKMYKSKHASYKEEYMNGNIFITLGVFFFIATK